MKGWNYDFKTVSWHSKSIMRYYIKIMKKSWYKKLHYVSYDFKSRNYDILSHDYEIKSKLTYQIKKM